MRQEVQRQEVPPSIRIEVNAKLESIDDKLTGLQLLAKLEGFHLGLEIFYCPSERAEVEEQEQQTQEISSEGMTCK